MPLAATIRRIADEHCAGSVAYVLEGGYGIDALAASIGAIARVHDAHRHATAGDTVRLFPDSVGASLHAFLKLAQGSR